MQEAKQYADENGLLFVEASAKTGVNVNEVFVSIGALPLLHPYSPVSLNRITNITAKKLPKESPKADQRAGAGGRVDLGQDGGAAGGQAKQGCC